MGVPLLAWSLKILLTINRNCNNYTDCWLQCWIDISTAWWNFVIDMSSNLFSWRNVAAWCSKFSENEIRRAEVAKAIRQNDRRNGFNAYTCKIPAACAPCQWRWWLYLWYIAFFWGYDPKVSMLLDECRLWLVLQHLLWQWGYNCVHLSFLALKFLFYFEPNVQIF